MMPSSVTTIATVLEERKDRLSPDEANELGLPRVEKIDFQGKPYLVGHKPTRTNMIIVKRGDVLVSGINAEKGALCIFNEADEATATIHYSAYKIDETKASREFLEWFLRSKFFRKALIDQVGGGIKTEIKAKKFLSIQVPVPDIQQQNAIVERLKHIASSTHAIEKSEEQNLKLVDELRKKILLSAIRAGEHSDWKPNQEYPLPDDWEWVPLSDLLVEKPRNGYSPTAVNHETDVKTLRLAATTSGKFKNTEFKYIAEKIEPSSYLWLYPGDILIQRSNSIDYVGVSAVYDDGPYEFIYPDLMMKLRVKEDVSSEYIHLVLSSPFLRNYFRASASGTSGNMPKINQKIVMKAMIPLPPFPKQTQIVDKTRKLLSQVDELAGIIEKQNTLIPQLLNATLNKALSEDAVPILAKKPAGNINFAIQQAIGALLNRGFKKGEMAIAKVLYLLQEVYKVPIGIQFTAQSFGPYDASVRKALTSGLSQRNKFFANSGTQARPYYELQPGGSKVLKYKLAQEANKALDDLLPKLGNAQSTDIERLASVCKIIQDNKTTDEASITSRMQEWKPDKFTNQEIKKAISYIKAQGWDKELLKS